MSGLRPWLASQPRPDCAAPGCSSSSSSVSAASAVGVPEASSRALAPRRVPAAHAAHPAPPCHTHAYQSSRALLDRKGGPPAHAPWNAELWVVHAAAARELPAAATAAARAVLASPTFPPLSWLPAISAFRAGLGSSSSSPSSSSAAGPWRGSGCGLPAQPLASLATASAAAAAAPSRGTRCTPSASAPSDVTTSVGALKRKRAGESDVLRASARARHAAVRQRRRRLRRRRRHRWRHFTGGRRGSGGSRRRCRTQCYCHRRCPRRAPRCLRLLPVARRSVTLACGRAPVAATARSVAPAVRLQDSLRPSRQHATRCLQVGSGELGASSCVSVSSRLGSSSRLSPCSEKRLRGLRAL